MLGSLKDAPVPLPPPEDPWSGFYGAIGLGAGRLDYGIDVDATKTTTHYSKDRKCRKVMHPGPCHTICLPQHGKPGKHGKHHKDDKYGKHDAHDKKSGGDCHAGSHTGPFQHAMGFGGKDKKADKSCPPPPKPQCKKKTWCEPPTFTYVCDGDWTQHAGTPQTISKSAHYEDDDWHPFATVQVGYDRLLRDRFLIGAFADFDFYNSSSSNFSGSLDGLATFAGSIALDHVWSGGGRLGVLLNERILLFASGGYTQASIDSSLDVTFTGGPTLAMNLPDELHGYFVGGGGELKLDRNVSLKLEYRWSDFGSGSASASSGPLQSSTVDCIKTPHCAECKQWTVTEYNVHSEFDAGIHSLRANLVWKFSDPEPPPALK